MAKNLIEELGVRYLEQMVLNAWVRVGEKVHYLQQVSRDGFVTQSFALSDPKAELVPDRLDADAIKSLADLQYPKLGYREVTSTSNKIVQVVQLHTRRSAMRGLRTDYLLAESMPVFTAVHPDIYNAWEESRPNVNIYRVFKPSFTNFAEGVRDLLRGERLAFAVSEDIAVVSACLSGVDRAADILFRGKTVGTIADDGEINLANKIANRAALLRHFEG